MLKAPLANAVEDYIARGRVRGHMPGHKGQAGGYLARFGELAPWDLTEADGLDDLHSPQGAIKETQTLMARACGAREAFLLVNGATSGIQAAVLAACRPGDTLLLPRNAHRAVWSAMALGDIKPCWLPVGVHNGLPLALTPAQIDAALTDHPEVKAVFLLNPSFYGVFGDLPACIAAARRHNVITIIDEAHGAHLPFAAPSLAAARLGADLTVDSWHKSMGSLGQTAVLLNNRADLHPGHWLTLLQTSSPSYPLLASLDLARAEWQKYSAVRVQKLHDAAAAVNAAVSGLQNLRIITAADLPSGFAYDETKVLLHSAAGHTGWQIAEALRACGVEPEFADSRFALYLLTYADGGAEQLCAALPKADTLLPPGHHGLAEYPLGPFLLPKAAQSPFAAAHAPRREVALEHAVVMISAGLLTPYPPGIPAVGMGEVISAELAAGLKMLLQAGGRVQGINNGRVAVIDETGAAVLAQPR